MIDEKSFIILLVMKCNSFISCNKSFLKLSTKIFSILKRFVLNFNTKMYQTKNFSMQKFFILNFLNII